MLPVALTLLLVVWALATHRLLRAMRAATPEPVTIALADLPQRLAA